MAVIVVGTLYGNTPEEASFSSFVEAKEKAMARRNFSNLAKAIFVAAMGLADSVANGFIW